MTIFFIVPINHSHEGHLKLFLNYNGRIPILFYKFRPIHCIYIILFIEFSKSRPLTKKKVKIDFTSSKKNPNKNVQIFKIILKLVQIYITFIN